jgi:hypothetical protein
MRYSRHGISYVPFQNNARDFCHFVLFQWLLDTVVAGDGGVDLPSKRKAAQKKDKQGQQAVYRSSKFAIDVNVKLPEKEEKDTDKDAGDIDLFFGNRALDKLYQDLLKRQKPPAKVIEYNLRSPERMVRFLGDIIAVQQLAERPREIKIFMDKVPVDLFVVRRGANYSGRSAVSIVDPEGVNFYVPIPDHGSPTKALSLQTLALVMDFLNSAVSGKTLPQPTTLIVTGG